MAKDLARLSINMATVRQQWNLRQCLDGFARHGIGGLAVWREPLQKVGVTKGARMIRDSGLAVSGLCRAGLFPAADAAGRRKADDEVRLAIDEAAEIGAQCLIIVAGGLPPGSKDIAGARRQVWEGTAKALDYAREAGVKLAIEPLHPMYAADRCCINTLGQALDLCDALGEGIGVAVDCYHVWWDPELERQISRAGKARLLAFHVCDWLVPTRDLLLDRGMMGDGVIDIPKIRGWLEAAGYDGMAEVEIFSAENWWKRDPDEVCRVAIERYHSAV
jgi:sugar phosphate isomerase/epimerase